MRFCVTGRRALPERITARSGCCKLPARAWGSARRRSPPGLAVAHVGRHIPSDQVFHQRSTLQRQSDESHAAS